MTFIATASSGLLEKHLNLTICFISSKGISLGQVVVDFLYFCKVFLAKNCVFHNHPKSFVLMKSALLVGCARLSLFLGCFFKLPCKNLTAYLVLKNYLHHVNTNHTALSTPPPGAFVC